MRIHIVMCIIVFACFVAFCLMDAGHFRGIDPQTDYGVRRVFNRAYLTAVTGSTIGYGDIVPTSVVARTIVIVISAAVYIHIVSVIHYSTRPRTRRDDS